MKYLNTRLLLYLGTLFLIVNSASGQLIDGPANCRDTINGEILYILEDSIYVYAFEPQNNWYKIRIDAYIDINDYSNGILKNGAKLMGYNNEILGETKTDIKTWLDKYNAGGRTHTVVHLEAFTYKSNIRTNTILEREIERIINNPDEIKRKREINEIVRGYGFYPHEVSGYTVFTTYDGKDYMLSAEIRMFIYFQGSELVAIAKDWRELNIESLKHGKIDRDFDIYYFVPMTNEEEDKFKEEMDKYFSFRD